MSTFNSGFFNSGSVFLQASNADFHSRENEADKAKTDEPTYKVITPNGDTYRGLTLREAQNLCNSNPGSRGPILEQK